MGGWILKLTLEPQSTRAWATGARGEELLAAALTGMDDIRVLHDRRAPRTHGNIDHLVIAPAGIFVIDAKHYSGTIRIRNRGNIFRPDHRLYVGRRDCSKLVRGMSWQVEAVATALRRANLEPFPTITPVLCFVDGVWSRFGGPDAFEGVLLESPRSIRKLFAASDAMSPDAILRASSALSQALPAKAYEAAQRDERDR